MKLVILACLVAVAAARPQEEFYADSRTPDGDAVILSQTNINQDDGSNESAFEASNGIIQSQTIVLRQVERVNEEGDLYTAVIPIYTGKYQYINDLGELQVGEYFTDEYGQFKYVQVPQGPKDIPQTDA